MFHADRNVWIPILATIIPALSMSMSKFLDTYRIPPLRRVGIRKGLQVSLMEIARRQDACL